MALIDIVRISLIAFFSMVSNPEKYSARSWSTEFTFRLSKRLLRESSTRPIPWLRSRQALLKMYSPALFKVVKKKKSIAAVACLSFRPKEITDPEVVILYFHGGGYVVGTPDGYSVTMTKIALAANAQVIGIDYRLAPEHAIPAAQNDCFEVTKALLNDPQYQGKKIILMGDSAGGGLCLSVINALSNTNANVSMANKAGVNKVAVNKIAACVLISPWLAAMDQTKLELAHEDSDLLDRVILSRWTNTIVTDKTQQFEQLDFTGMEASILPPVYIQSAGAEVFSKQITAFVASLQLAHVDYQHEVFEQQFHVFQTLSPLVKEADDAILRIGLYVQGVK